MVKTTLEGYRKVQELRIIKLKKVRRKTPIVAAKYMSSVARRLAPRDTGNLIRNIVRRTNQVRIGGSNPVSGFPYVHWVNQSKGYKLLQARRYTDFKGRPYVYIKGNWIHVKGGLMIYGSAPASWNWSGTPRFATIAINSARQFYRNTMVENTRKAIRLEG